MKRLSKTGIEYGDLNWNFYPGCLHKPQGICSVPHCWAEGMSKRHLQDFHKPFLIPELLLAPLSVKKPSVILVNFMGDLFGDWVNPGMEVNPSDEGPIPAGKTLKEVVFDVVKLCPQHQFLFLTKAPWNYKRWSDFPDNAWLGATVANKEAMVKALYSLTEVKAGGRWLSVEPMYGPVVPAVWPAEWDEIRWVVIGAQGNPVKYPEVDWVEHLVMESFKSGKRIWLKHNLAPALPPTLPFYVPPKVFPAKGAFKMLYRQEMPKAVDDA